MPLPENRPRVPDSPFASVRPHELTGCRLDSTETIVEVSFALGGADSAG